jgi:hypothetical protein
MGNAPYPAGDAGALELRVAPRRYVGFFGLMVVGLCSSWLGMRPHPDHFGIVAWRIHVALTVVGSAGIAVSFVRLRRMGWVIRLDADGVALHGRPVIPWSSISEVRLRPRRGRGPDVVVFMGVPGVELPLVPTGWSFSRSAARAAAYVSEFGSPLVVAPWFWGVTSFAVLDAVRRFSSTPVDSNEPPTDMTHT